MADIAITIAALDKDVGYRQAQMPSYVYGSFVGEDTDDHAAKVDGRGKGRLTYAVDNATDQTVTVTLYGMHTATGEVGGTGVFAIDSTGFAVTTATTGYETNNDPFPYYLIRCTFAVTPTGDKDVTVYANLSAF